MKTFKTLDLLMLWYHKRAWKPKSGAVSVIQQISRRALMKNSFSKVAFTWVFSCIDLLYHLSNTFFSKNISETLLTKVVGCHKDR